MKTLSSSSEAAVLFSAKIIHDFDSQMEFFVFFSLPIVQCFVVIDKMVFFYRVVTFL